MRSKKITDFLDSTEKILPKRILLALGLILLIVAQIYFETREPFGEHITDAVIWNAVSKLELVNYDNVWSALPYLFCGFLLWLWLGSFQWMEPAAAMSLPAERSNPNIAPQLLIIAALYGILLIRIAQQYNTYLEPALWIFALAWLTYLIWNWERRDIDLTPDFNAADLTAILILLIIGIAIGSFALTDLPKQIMPDELPFWDASRMIALGEREASFFEVGVFTFPLSTSIFQSWIMRIFGVTFWSWRFSSVLAGVATVIPLYLLARNWFDRRVAFTAGLMMLVNPYFLSFSRFGYNNIHSLFPVTLAIYLWEKGIRRNSIFYLWLGGLAAGLGYYSFFAAWIAAVVIGLSVFYLRLHKQISRKQVLEFLFILIAAFAFMAAPRVTAAVSSGRSESLIFKVFQASFINSYYGYYYYVESDLTSVHSLIPISGDVKIFFQPQIYREFLARGVIRTLLAIVDPYIATEHFPVSGFAGVITPIFFVIGLALTLKSWKQYRSGLLLLWLFGGLFFLSVISAFPPRHTHLVAIIPVLAILSALGLTSTIEQIIKQTSAHKLVSALTALAITFFSLQAFFIKLPIVHPADFEDHAAWIARRKDQSNTIIYVNSTGKTPDITRSLIDSKIIQGKYFTTPAQFAVQEALGYAKTPTLIFYEGRNETLPREMQKVGFGNYEVYKNKDILGYVFTNADISPSPDTSLYSELILFLKSPAPIVLGILLGALGIHLINEQYYIVKLFAIKKSLRP
jgi:4-amino-4-deoxy-L-arabinose transferase-like glycosyltransferase